MKVGQQIRFRLDQLGVSVPELARRVGVSAQAVRFWLDGRSFPGKRHAPALEQALSFAIDYTEGVSKSTGRESAADIMGKLDLELALKLARLPPTMKVAMSTLVDECLSLQGVSRGPLASREKPASVKAFFNGRGQIAKKSTRRTG